MIKSLTKLAITASIMLALTFTLSCSGDDGDEGGGNNSGGGSSSSKKQNSSSPSQSQVRYDTPVTYRGKTYKTVKIGEQIWMTENLNIEVEGSVCYEGKPANCDKYGRLYTWAAAMDIDAKYNDQAWGGSDVKHQGICPSGWHIPSYSDWYELEKYIEKENDCWLCSATYLKSASGWNTVVKPGNGNDKYGFSALPSGYFSHGSYSGVNSEGVWWGSGESDGEEYENMAEYWSMVFSVEIVWFGHYEKDYLLSVRCVRDS